MMMMVTTIMGYECIRGRGRRKKRILRGEKDRIMLHFTYQDSITKSTKH
jgi:hypothetical protein